MAAPKGEREFQLIIFGATGFTGKLAVQYMANQYGKSGKSVKWGIGGRNHAKMMSMVDSMGLKDVLQAEHMVVADSSDSKALKALVERTDVVVSCAGPFSRYGSLLVAECVHAGTDYCDITGEIHWVREMIAAHDDEARQTGARIVHLCGHDSVPWDLCTMMLAKKLKESNESLSRVEFYDEVKASPSGGTLETAFGILFGPKLVQSPTLKSFGYDVLLKDGEQKSESALKSRNVGLFDFKKGDKRSHRILFVMADTNGNTVKRSNALNHYGDNVIYNEGAECKSLLEVFMTLFQLISFGLLIMFPPTRWFMRSFVLPKPGEGPSEESMKAGYMNVTGVAKGTNGSTAKCVIKFYVDPGYKDTARMVVESGLALALESDSIACKGGVVTPAACQGETLLNRIVQTGSTFEYFD